MSERKLASIQKILAIDPIDGADAIEVATINSWKVVCKKNEFKVGDLVTYFEIDSWIPSKIAPWLTKPGHFPKAFESVEGERLRTIRLRGQISQGLIMPVSIIPDHYPNEDKDVVYRMQKIDGGFSVIKLNEGDDVTELLGILKYEKPLPACLAGQAKGNFPSRIRKTDQERIQNLTKEFGSFLAMKFEVTEKLEGSSMTASILDGEFIVCSRNLNLKETEGNTFWDTARKFGLEEKLRTLNVDIAVQGELIGPGIQNNIYGLSSHEFRVFDVFDPNTGTYLSPAARRNLCKMLDIPHVPVIDEQFNIEVSIDDLIKIADGKSVLNNKTNREGLVYKSIDGQTSFKTISNAYLLKETDA